MNTSDTRILVIDDDRTVCSSLMLLLKRKGYTSDFVHFPAVALDKISQFIPHVILLDMNFTIDTSGKQGIKLLEKIRDRFPDIQVILMTGWATVDLAVRGMKLGARDFLAKPWDNKELLSSIEDVIQLFAHKSTIPNLSQEGLSAGMIGEHKRFLEVVNMAQKVAPTEANVLIMGESGTGKELLAESIHMQSNRAANDFVKVNLGGISTSLFESEMFGHKKGAFTGAVSDREGRFSLAHKGTLFLDELGELSMESQVKLLRVLQEKSFEVLGSSKTIRSDFRLVSATNKSLEDMVHAESFREDLFYRVNLITLFLPSLEERASDIPLLVKHFINQVEHLYQREAPYIETETLEWLSKQQYPGNIRALKNQVERAVLLNFDKKEIQVNDFKEIRNLNNKKKYSVPEVGALTLDQMEEHMIIRALDFHEHNISKAARSLGITRSSLYRRIEKYNIPYEPSI